MSAKHRAEAGGLRAVVARVGWAPLTLVAGVLATCMLALSMNGTFAAWTASIRSSGNSANTGTLTMQETGPGGTPVVCNSTDGSGNGINTNAATCVGINHYGGATLVPGASTTTSVTLKNTGTVAANSVSVTFAPCTQSSNAASGNIAGSATNLCDVMYLYVNVNIAGVTTAVTSSGSISLTAANTTGTFTMPALGPGVSAIVNVSVGLSGALGNTYQGLTATQPITFQFSS